jgi:predicted  nucleic acid-binding Zn-ribbon protein
MIRQLYQLQELELDIEHRETALARCEEQMGESRQLVESRSQVNQQEKLLEQLKGEQKTVEWELEDLEAKLAAAREVLYSGRIKNPKDLASLQHEVAGLRDRSVRLEEGVLDVMEHVEIASASLNAKRQEFRRIEEQWRDQQQRLSADIEQLIGMLSGLRQQAQENLAVIDHEAVILYQQLKKRRGWAVARVEQGACRGCGMSLSTAELQWAKGNRLIQCNNCSRILFQE